MRTISRFSWASAWSWAMAFCCTIHPRASSVQPYYASDGACAQHPQASPLCAYGVWEFPMVGKCDTSIHVIYFIRSIYFIRVHETKQLRLLRHRPPFSPHPGRSVHFRLHFLIVLPFALVHRAVRHSTRRAPPALSLG
jgi:hypothetical protein